MRTRLAFVSWVLLSLVLALGWGCSATNKGSVFGAGGGDTGTDTSGGGGAGNGGIGTGGGFTTITGGGGGKNGKLVITPAPAQIKVSDGNVQKQAFKATVNGNDVTSKVTWSYTRPEIGDIDASGTFTPTGKIGGNGTLTAKYQALEGDTTVEVFVEHAVNSAGLTPQQIAQFDKPAGADPSLSLVYPYDGTVFPLAVLAPEMQWDGAQGGDVYRLQLKEKYYTYSEYFTQAPPANHLVAQPDWDAVETSGAGAKADPLAVSLTRQTNGQAYQPVTQTWHIAQGRLHGSVYYWELPDQCGNGNGRILRIKPDSDQPDEFFQPGTCFGCHTVSRNGKRMAAEFDNGNGPLYTVALDQNPVGYGEISPNNPSKNYIFSAFNDKGDKLLACDNSASDPSQATLQIVDSTSGAVLNPNAMGSGCGEPAWSPDGKKIAGICGLGNGGGWVFDASSGNLAIADVGPDGTSVSNVQTIVPQAGGDGRPAYPSFSPDSKFLTFGRPTAGSRSTGNGKLYLVGQDGSGLQELSTASSDGRSFNPVFAPLRAGGYYWIVFITRRDYGHKLVGQDRQQLWITAVDDPPAGGDPSHPPFYMRGQEDCGKSENAYYALDPCKEKGQDCASGIDCCNGQCVKDAGTGKYTCGEPPPPGTCSAEGNSCKTQSDCCDKIDDCIDGFCQKVPPK
jgi:hypothetical protein